MKYQFALITGFQPKGPIEMYARGYSRREITLNQESEFTWGPVPTAWPAVIGYMVLDEKEKPVLIRTGTHSPIMIQAGNHFIVQATLRG